MSRRTRKGNRMMIVILMMKMMIVMMDTTGGRRRRRISEVGIELEQMDVLGCQTEQQEESAEQHDNSIIIEEILA